MDRVVMLGVLLAAGSAMAANVERVFLPERYERGDTNIRVVQRIDNAAWIWHPTVDGDEEFNKQFHGDVVRTQFHAGWRGQRFLRFERTFSKAGDAPLEFDVSADERFVLLLNNEVIARGPNRGTLDHWGYESYRVQLAPGEHTLAAVVWQVGPFAPFAQLSWRGGFILKAEGAYDALLTTGKADWRVAELKNTVMTHPNFGVGADTEVNGTAFLYERPGQAAFAKAVVVRNPQTNQGCGLRYPGWMLTPSALPDQMETFRTPGAVKAARADTKPDGAYTAADAASPHVAAFNALLKDGKALTLPAHSEASVLWDLDDYYCAYPELTASGGKGARVSWCWDESLWGKNGKKGNRDSFEDKRFRGHVDVFTPDGRADGHFTTPWWRCGRWCQLVIKTADEPLTLTKLGMIESRYPTPPAGSFVCDDPSLVGVQKICVRGMQMCMHEMFFDCPFYEQQMYPGDTRVQLLTVGALNNDDRLIRHAIELYDFSRRDNGTVGFNFPTYGTQEGATYTLIWAFMFRDYMMWHNNQAWLKARMPGLRMMLHGMALYENADGLLENLPGWSFMDWVPGWSGGDAPDGSVGQGVSSLNNLLYVYALQSAADVETALGEPLLAAHWRAKADAVGKKVVAKFWSDGRGMLADTVKKDKFSEHAQCLALLSGILSPAQSEQSFKGLLEAKDLARTTVYFSHYLFDTYAKYGRADLILKRLDLWRDYVKLGLRTPLESPGDGARSDCHAWGAHPLLHLQRDVAGVSPAEPFFKSVRVAPCPGGLKHIASSTPHPNGMIQTDFTFDGDTVRGSVTLPEGVNGVFEWRGKTTALKPGKNAVQ